jgi:hypothetical protein
MDTVLGMRIRGRCSSKSPHTKAAVGGPPVAVGHLFRIIRSFRAKPNKKGAFANEENQDRRATAGRENSASIRRVKGRGHVRRGRASGLGKNWVAKGLLPSGYTVQCTVSARVKDPLFSTKRRTSTNAAGSRTVDAFFGLHKGVLGRNRAPIDPKLSPLQTDIDGRRYKWR